MDRRGLGEWFIVSCVLFMLVIALVSWIVEDASAQTDTPNYTVFRENHWYGYDSEIMPCDLLEFDWYNDEIVREVIGQESMQDTITRYDMLIIDWDDGVFYEVFTHGETDYALRWSNFELGTDGHPHPNGAYIVDCQLD